MDYAAALAAIKRGEVVARLGWWGLGMYLQANPATDGVSLCYVDDGSVKVWHANVADENATDWLVFDGVPVP